MKTHITLNLDDLRLLKVLKKEAFLQKKSIQDIIIQALRAYFSNKNEPIFNRVFEEWDNPRDADYDLL